MQGLSTKHTLNRKHFNSPWCFRLHLLEFFFNRDWHGLRCSSCSQMKLPSCVFNNSGTSTFYRKNRSMLCNCCCFSKWNGRQNGFWACPQCFSHGKHAFAVRTPWDIHLAFSEHAKCCIWLLSEQRPCKLWEGLFCGSPTLVKCSAGGCPHSILHPHLFSPGMWKCFCCSRHLL